MKRLLFLLVLLIPFSLLWTDDLGYRKQTMTAIILVDNRFETSDKIEEWVDDEGGYLLSRLEDSIILRIPSNKLEALSDHLVKVSREVVSIQQKTEDIGQQILEREAGIRSKEELFRQALVLIDDSDYASTLEIESEILSILDDIENLKGNHSKLLAESKLARVKIDYTIEEETIPQEIRSSFPWINLINYYQLIAEFRRR